MKPAPFEYAAPTSLDEAVAVFAERGDEAKVLAGGQSLVPLLAFRLAAPSVVVDLNRIEGLDHARIDGDTLVLGALARHRAAERLEGLADRCAMVTEAASLVGHVAIRNRGTVCGSIAHADPAAEWPSLALALDAEIDAVGPNGRRTIPAGEFFVTYFTTALEPTEIVTEARFRLPAGRVGSAYQELARRHGDFALAGAGALLQLDRGGAIGDARVVLIGVRDTAVRSTAAEAVLRGNAPGPELFAEAAEAIDGEIEPLSDVHATGDYRRHVAKVLVRRTVAAAHERAGGGAS